MIEKTVTPGLPVDAPKGAILYRLRYKQGNNCDHWKLFYHVGDLTSAIVRGRNHCSVMNYKFLHVEPCLIDLDAEEKRFTEN